MSLEILDKDVGGAWVKRTFNMRGRQLQAGESLTHEEYLSINLPNRRALVETHHLEPWPKAPPGERIIVQVAKGEFNVFEGHAINETPLTHEEAKHLARQ